MGQHLAPLEPPQEARVRGECRGQDLEPRTRGEARIREPDTYQPPRPEGEDRRPSREPMSEHEVPRFYSPRRRHGILRRASSSSAGGLSLDST